MEMMNTIYREEAAKLPWVEYLDTWPLFADENGRYSAYLEIDGEETLVRNPDGVHLVRDGGEVAAEKILEVVLEAAGVEQESPTETLTVPRP
jgi:hypothetical protein